MNVSTPLAESLPEIADAVAWFEHFAAGYMIGEACPPLELKVRHTKLVTLLAGRLVHSLELGGELRRSALLSALLHDVGRFPQYREWQTFRDAISVNHGRLGARLLHGAPVLAGESAAVRRTVLAAVALHNRYMLPAHLPERVRIATQVVRDADKIDILRVFSEELAKPEPSDVVVLHVAREPDKWTPDIVERVVRGETPDYRDLHYVNDFIIMLCSWLNSLNFSESLRLVRESGHMEQIVRQLPERPEMDAVRRMVRDRLERA